MKDHLTPFWSARRQALRAMQRGDLDSALHWTVVLRCQMRMARSLGDLRGARPRPRPKPPKPAAPVESRSKGPVMLDPDGFSPGGTPNWLLNQQRRERAGLPPVAPAAPPPRK